MPVTTISRRFCQRERFRSVESLRVMSFEPTASTSISPQVNTMVPLSLRNPCCQKIISSGLRRMAGLLCRASLVFDRRAGQPRHDEACQDKSKRGTAAAAPNCRARQNRIPPGQCSSAAAGCRRTKAPAVRTKRPCEPSTKGRRRKSRRATRPPANASTRVNVSFIVILLFVPHRLVFLGHPMPGIQTADARARPPAAPASRNALPG